MSFLRTTLEMRPSLGYGLSQRTQKLKKRFCSTRPKSENIMSKLTKQNYFLNFCSRIFLGTFSAIFLGLEYLGYFQTFWLTSIAEFGGSLGFLGLCVFLGIWDIFRTCLLTSLIAEFGGSLGLFLGFSFMSVWDLVGLVRPSLWIKNLKQQK